MNKEKINGIELTEKELEQVSGGNTGDSENGESTFSCPQAELAYPIAKHCQNQPCYHSLQPLQAYGFYCPIIDEYVTGW